MTKKELQQKLAEARQKIIELEQQRDTLIKIAGELQNKTQILQFAAGVAREKWYLLNEPF
jgi:hypothetical protein